jgi:hypothetical protein
MDTLSGSDHYTQAAAVANLPFPRIGNYYAYDHAGLAPIFTRYSLVIVPDTITWTDPAAIQALHIANPTATVLAYDDPALIDYTNLNRFGTHAIFPGWFALSAGSTLAGGVTSSQTTLRVANAAHFALYADVLVGSESMHITAIHGNTLRVVRGWYSTAAAHPAGARIAPHGSKSLGGPDLDNRSLATQRPWLLNESSDCPLDPVHHQTWLQYFEHWLKTHVLSAKRPDHVTPLWDGIFLDDSNDVLYHAEDLNNDGVNDPGGVVSGVNVWAAGLAHLFRQIRADFPAALLLGNGPAFSNFSTANGQEFYEPHSWIAMSLYGGMMANYHNHMANAVRPQLSFLHPNTPGGPPNLQLMRFGLTSALLDDGAFVYDRGATQEGTPWWFDEYDKGAGTALASAINSTTTSIPVIHTNRFRVGDTVVVEDEMMRVLAIGKNRLRVLRSINGTYPASHEAGQVVATMAQVQAGLGYLGRPLGPASTIGISTTNLVPNGSFKNNLLPWTLYAKTTPAATVVRIPTIAVKGTSAARITVPVASTYDSDVGFYNQDIVLAKGSQYIASFAARSSISHKVHMIITTGAGLQNTIADATIQVGAAWGHYAVLFDTPSSTSKAQILFALADTPATTWLAAVKVVKALNPIQRRDFTHGTVLVNASTRAQRVNLSRGGPYCHLRGDQNPRLNNGTTVTSVTIAPRDGLILLHC